MPALIQRPSLLSPLSAEDIGQLKIALPSLNILSYQGPGDRGGVSNSLEPLAKQIGSKIRWLAVSGLPETLDTAAAGFCFQRLALPDSSLAKLQDILSNYLNPLFHGTPGELQMSAELWKSFRQLNELVATDCLQADDDSYPALFWLHDYQLLLTAPLLARQAGVILCQFWHAPWPEVEVMSGCPFTAEIVEALLANRLLGFHTNEYAQNFLHTVQALLPQAQIDLLTLQVRYQGHQTKICVMPLGIDFAYWQRISKASRPKAAAIPKKYGLANQLILAVDRLEPSKGIAEKLRGLARFLEQEPSWHRRFHYVQLAQAPLLGRNCWSAYRQEVQSLVNQINQKWQRQGWQPILWLEDNYPQEDLAAWYQAADVMCVTPLRDGLNLIAKEFAASRLDEQGVLILSKQTGVANELSTGALLVDARQPAEIARQLSAALSMSFEEKRRRMLSMRHIVAWNRLDDWALGFLKQALSD